MADLDLVLAQDNVGLAVFESDHPTNNARRLIRVVNTLAVEAVSPNPPATLRLDVPGNCLELNGSFSAGLSAKKDRRKSTFRPGLLATRPR